MSAPNLGGVGFLRSNAPSYSEQLLRVLDMKGDIPGEVAARLSASYQLDDLRRPEFAWLRRARRFAQGQTIAAVAGQFGVMEFYLNTAAPVGSMIAITDHLCISNQSGGVATLSCALREFPLLGAFAATEFGILDDRQAAFTAGAPVDYRPAFNLQSTNNVSSGGALTGQSYSVTLPAATSIILPLAYVVTGKAVLRVAAFNVAFGLNISWTERELLESER
jgi:hypothetical protein